MVKLLWHQQMMLLPLTTTFGAVAATTFFFRRFLLWRARRIAQTLEVEDAHRDIDNIPVWNDGGRMMMDCSNEELLESILQRAIDRGKETLAACKKYNDMILSTHEIISPTKTLYQSSSSSFSSSSSPSSSPSKEEVDFHHETLRNKRPQPMRTQVGGIATHKRPMLMLDHFIMKPLRLMLDANNTSENYYSAHHHAEDETTATIIHNETIHREGKGPARNDDGDDKRVMNRVVDSTAAFRGIREVALYESLAFASSVPSTLTAQRIRDEDPARNVHSKRISRAMMRMFHKCTVVQQQLSPAFGIFCRQDRQSTNFSKLGHFDTAILQSACYAGDSVVASRVQSNARAWRALHSELEALKLLSQFTAPYFGVLYVDDSEGHARTPPTRQPHLLLQNLIAPFRQPNLIDLKMGTRTYEPTAPLSKQISQAAKYPQQLVLGFRIVGMGTHTLDGTYQYWDKSFGVGLKRGEDVIAAFMTFFQCDNAPKNKSYILYILACVIQQLKQIRNWFEVNNSSLVFYASSILIVYENIVPVDDVSFSTCNAPVVKMIDFAHVCRRAGGDEGYLKGLRSLLNILHEVHRRIS